MSPGVNNFLVFFHIFHLKPNLKALGFQNTTFLPGGDAEVVKTVFSLWSPEAGHFFYEWTGILTFIVGVFAMYYGYKFIQVQRPRVHTLETTA